MSAERLREAATLLRERVDALWDNHNGRWYVVVGAAGWAEARCHILIPEDESGPLVEADTFIFQNDTPPTTAYIALMAPPVALALADWLSDTASYLTPDWCAEDDLALRNAAALADAILGDAS